jgi:hypothetical protein
MKKITSLLFILLLLTAKVKAQDTTKVQEKRNIISIGTSYGFDKNINACRSEPNIYGNNFYNDKIYNNMSLDFGIYATKKFRPRIEFKYVRMGYSAGWDSTGVTVIEETVVDLYNFNINMHFDYMLLNVKKFDLLISPAFKWEHTMGDEFYNLRIDGTKGYNNYGNINSEYPEDVIGGAISAIVKYNLTKHIGITLTPEYTLFINEFVSTNDKYYQRVSVNAGLEFAF